MALDVLQSKSQIRDSRNIMRSRGISFTDSPQMAVLKRLGLSPQLSIGDVLTSWDVLKTVEFLERSLPSEAAILDIGCFCSEVLLCLHDLGFTNLSGCDLNPEIARMPYARAIDYRVDDFLCTSFADASFDAVTSVSVLEHGFDGPAFLKEASRLVKPGGYLLSSFDYWPEKIDTGDTRFFGMSWTLFSQEEIYDLIEDAKEYGFHPVGGIATAASGRPIKCAGYNYTFGWLALRKLLPA